LFFFLSLSSPISTFCVARAVLLMFGPGEVVLLKSTPDPRHKQISVSLPPPAKTDAPPLSVACFNLFRSWCSRFFLQAPMTLGVRCIQDFPSRRPHSGACWFLSWLPLSLPLPLSSPRNWQDKPGRTLLACMDFGPPRLSLPTRSSAFFFPSFVVADLWRNCVLAPRNDR